MTSASDCSCNWEEESVAVKLSKALQSRNGFFRPVRGKVLALPPELCLIGACDFRSAESRHSRSKFASTSDENLTIHPFFGGTHTSPLQITILSYSYARDRKLRSRQHQHHQPSSSSPPPRSPREHLSHHLQSINLRNSLLQWGTL